MNHDWQPLGPGGSCTRCGEMFSPEAAECGATAPALKVVPLRDGAALLTDIAGQLEQFARDLRAGKVQAQRALMVIEDFDGEAAVFGWGPQQSAFHDLGLLDVAKDVVKDCIVNEPESAA